MGYIKKKYKPKEQNVEKLKEYFKKLNNKTTKKLLL